MRRIAVDANVFVSFFIDRNAAQHAAARALTSLRSNVAMASQRVTMATATMTESPPANKLEAIGLASYW